MRESISRALKVYMQRIGTIPQIRTRLHPTWYVAFVLTIWVIVTQLPEDNPLWERIIFGAAGTLLFFIVVNIRQFLINLVTVLTGVPLRNVTLFVFGGGSQVPRNVTRPVLELVIAVT